MVVEPIVQGQVALQVDTLIEGFEIAISWPVIGWMTVGLLLGIVLGALPGIGSPVGMAIVLPLTLPLDSTSAIILLASIYSGAMFGGSIAAILINAPGTESAAATTLDGYPMAKQGLAKNALAIATTASALNGFLAAIVLILISPILIGVVLAFGSPEYFLLAILGISLITIVTQGSIVKGLVAGALGLMISTIGTGILSPTPRFTFGQFGLYNGIDFVAALIGMFAFAEMMKLAARSQIAESDIELAGSIKDGVMTVFKYPKTTLKAGVIGMLIGMIPGSGATTSTFVAYAEEARSSAKDGRFGDGDPRGVIAPEGANNPTVSGSLVPTLSFGIPGSGSTAVLLGGLLMHGLQPGPTLFGDQLQITYALFISLFLSNILIVLVGLSVIPYASRITEIDTNVIIPVVVVLSFIGAFTLNRNWFDTGAVIALGLLGYYMVKYNYSVIAFVLGIVLGPIAEENFFRSLQISGGDYGIFFDPIDRPLSFLLTLGIFLILSGPFLKPYFERIVSRA
ncbi:tripartite tricarboxylate transporter permease [Halalkalicoccus sp. NIPERK01]|uniref:tripartite tricarboxylate transporter permease n=1 Tax=Halalkalicoccus sp. NIPERK01 TaxID=3053469 RepID=UPI00256EE1D6|nr:tripartite tricarboxylate transporter permease [Halalkalicoccus sp. NIPERK01]MDL5360745.1 tripartite tricarboxylate transporter permease [Halalkalicoccus sp. NIPERK01]